MIVISSRGKHVPSDPNKRTVITRIEDPFNTPRAKNPTITQTSPSSSLDARVKCWRQIVIF